MTVLSEDAVDIDIDRIRAEDSNLSRTGEPKLIHPYESSRANQIR